MKKVRWWKCAQRGCQYDAKMDVVEAKKSMSMSYMSTGDLVAKVMQVHLLNHVCDLLAKTQTDDKMIDRALRAAERAAVVAEAMVVVTQAASIAAPTELPEPTA